MGLSNIDVWNHANDDVQTRLLPLQWAIDSVSFGYFFDPGQLVVADILQNFINMSTGVFPPSPYSWEYTNQSAEDLSENNRISELMLR